MTDDGNSGPMIIFMFFCFIILLLTIKNTINIVIKSIDSATLMFSQSNHSVKLILKMSFR